MDDRHTGYATANVSPLTAEDRRALRVLMELAAADVPRGNDRSPSAYEPDGTPHTDTGAGDRADTVDA